MYVACLHPIFFAGDQFKMKSMKESKKCGGWRGEQKLEQTKCISFNLIAVYM